jgi:hypothetical protein
MVEIVFPVTENLRMPLLILQWVFAFIAFELALIFLLKYRREESHLKLSDELGYAGLFFGISFMQFLFIFGNFFATISSLRNLYLGLGCIVIIIGACFFMGVMEKSRLYVYKRFLFTICGLVVLIVSIITFFIDLKLLQFIFYGIWPILFIFFVIHFGNFFKGAEDFKTQFTKFIPLLFLMMLGILLNTEYIMRFIGLELGLIGSICEFCAIGGLAYFFIKLPPFSEFEWKDTVEELLIMTKGGVCIYHQYFVDKVSHLSDVMISGALIGVNIMLDELTSTKQRGISVIKKRDKTVNIFSANSLVGVLITSEELNTVIYRLKEFIQKIENIYQNLLVKWDGHIEVFTGLEDLVMEHFT